MSHRIERIAEQLRAELSALIRAEVTDPRIGLITLMHVEVAADLCAAKILWSALDPKLNEDPAAMAEIDAGLESAKGFLRKRLAEDLPLRRVLGLHFRHDASIDLGSRTLEILREIENESKK